MWTCNRCLSVHGTNSWRKIKKGTSERQWSESRSTGSDIRGRMSERQPKKYIKQHISHPQVETGRWSSQWKAAWCQLIWRDAAAVKAELQKTHRWPWGTLRFNNEEWNRKLWGKKNSGGPLSPRFLFIAHSTPRVSTLGSNIQFHI